MDERYTVTLAGSGPHDSTSPAPSLPAARSRARALRLKHPVPGARVAITHPFLGPVEHWVCTATGIRWYREAR